MIAHCLFCGHSVSALPVECPGCSVELSYLIDPGTTWQGVFTRFEKKYGFDPRELFTRLKTEQPSNYIRYDAIAEITRYEDAVFLEEISRTCEVAHVR